jgi:retinol dehydrogenase 12
VTAARIAIVTGATQGIGKATAEGLLRAGCETILLVRDERRGDAVAADLERTTGRRPRLARADLADLRDLAAAARRLVAELPHVDILVNNAATIPPRRQTSRAGHELQFAVNHLAYHLLTRELVPALARAEEPRVVVVASNAHRHATLDLRDLEASRSYDARVQYQATKLMNVLFAREMAERLRSQRIAVNSLHPGVVGTGLLADYTPLGRLFAPLLRLVASDPATGAKTSLHVALDPSVAGVTGKHFRDCREVAVAPAARDPVVGRALFDASELLIARALGSG